MRRLATQVMGVLALLLASGTAQTESIPLISEHGTFVVPVVINDKITLNFTIDSGASDVSIPSDVFSTLVRAGTVAKSDFLDTQVYELADGSKQSAQRIRIRSLRIGNLELRDVIASVAPAEGSLLLGQSFLSRFKSWAIDNQAQVLLVNESVSSNTGIIVPRSDKVTPKLRWVSLGKTEDGFEFFVDESSIHVAADIRQAWTKTVPPPHTQRGTYENSSRWVSLEMMQRAFNCNEETEMSGALSIYYDDGSYRKISIDDVSPQHWESVTPDTFTHAEMRFICAWKPK
jgi:clan AA aspartic protease (TIGR02281 family)